MATSENPAVKTRAAFVAIVSNSCLIAIKLAAGILTGSVGILSDAVHSLMDLVASVISLLSVRKADEPADASHRYGHEKLEDLSAGAQAILLLIGAAFVAYEAIHRLIVGSDTTSSILGIAVTASAIVLMPLLGATKLRLGQRLGSTATAGEGIQNLMCAAQAAAARVALIGASAGLSVIDPIAALIVAAIAGAESVELWRGEQDCCASVGFVDPPASDRASTGGDCCAPNS